MDILIHPSKLKGSVIAPSSKSAAHRAVICACLAKGKSRISNIGNNDDIIASIDAAKALGANCYYEKSELIVEGISGCLDSSASINCKESGSTLRFFTPIVSALGIKATFYGEGRLPERPMKPIFELLSQHGVSVSNNTDGMFSLSGKIKSGIFRISGNVSSQYITGLMFALPLIDGDSEIILTTPLESAGYIDMTIQMLERFAIKINKTKTGYHIKGNQQYQPNDLVVEGDYSGAAFWLSAGAIGHGIEVTGLDKNSLQADKQILGVIEQFGANINYTQSNISVQTNELCATKIDGSGIPDSVPILAVVAAFARGTTNIYNAERLKIKESDRLMTTTKGLVTLGVDITETSDGLRISGGNPICGGTVDSFGDHRIAMAMSIVALSTNSTVKILGAECVNKSYPNFYEDFKALGGKFDVI